MSYSAAAWERGDDGARGAVEGRRSRVAVVSRQRRFWARARDAAAVAGAV